MDGPRRRLHHTEQLAGETGVAEEGARDGSGAVATIAAEAAASTHESPQGIEGGCRLPCQNNHNSTGDTPELPPSARRTALALQVNVQAMCERYGIEKVGFLTLTFREHILDSREAQRRMNSLITHVLRPRYGNTIRIIERQKSGRIHYHLLVAMAADIRCGFDFDAVARDDYRSANKALRAEWSFWRRTAPRYGFGRTELLPVKSTAGAIGRYVGKYIGKHIHHREERDRGVRLVSYTGEKAASTRFAWAGGKARDWRAKLRGFVQSLHEGGAIDEPTAKAMAKRFGPRWCWYWRDSIFSFPLEEGGTHGPG